MLCICFACSCRKDAVSTTSGPVFARPGTPIPATERMPLRLVDQVERAGFRVPSGPLKEHEKRSENRFAFVPSEFAPLMKNVAIGEFEGTLEILKSLFAPVPSEYTFELTLPPGASLEFATGILAGVDGKTTGDATFVVEATPAGGGVTKTLHRAEASGGKKQRWNRHRVDLAELGGKAVRLTLRTEGTADTLAVLGNPVVRGAGTRIGRPPNIVLFAWDTVRRDRLSLYGFPKPTSPELERLGARGTVFEQAISNANWSRPSYYSIFAGKMPSNLGISLNRFAITGEEEDYFYRHNKMTLPTLLKRTGYRTQAIGNNYFIVQSHDRPGVGMLGLDVGFEDVINFDQQKSEDAPLIAERAREWIADHKDEPFFLFVSFDNAHFPYEPLTKFAKPWTACEGCTDDEESRYHAAIAMVDHFTAQILAEVDPSNTVVIVFADHGEAFDPAHDYKMPRRGLGNVEWCRTLFDHGSCLYDEVLRVPLVVAGPGIRPGRVAKQVQLIDLFPTLLDLATVDRKALIPDGRSLTPFLAGQEDPGSPVVVSEGMDIRSVRTERFHYVFAEDVVRTVRRVVEGKEVEQDLKEQLFDLKADPAEHDNLVGKRPDLLAEARRQMDEAANERLFGIHLMLSGKAFGENENAYALTVTTAGAFTRAGAYRVEPEDRLDVGLDRRKFSLHGRIGQDEDAVVFQVTPPDAAIGIEIQVGGQTPGREKTAMGCLGMRFPDMPLKFADAKARKVIACDQAPDGAGVALWERAEPFAGKDSALDPEMKKLLKDWGYVHEDGPEKGK